MHAHGEKDYPGTLRNSSKMNDTGKNPTMSLASLAAMNAKIGLLSFGGGSTGLFYYELVTRRRVLSEQEFFSAQTVAQMLPGANVINLAVFFGQKLHGIIGAVVAVISLVAGPFFGVIGLYTIYDRLAGYPWVAAAIQGITAAAIGILLCVVLRGFVASGNLTSRFILIATMILVGILRLPLIPVVLCMVPVSIALAAYRVRSNG
jgi:chromate transporter